MSFLTTRVQAPAEDDWGKLKWGLKNLNGTRYLKLTQNADQLKFAMHWYVDGSHQIHEDCHGQTGSLVTFGQGAVATSSNKMKCNTKSSTETEIISFADKLANINKRYAYHLRGNLLAMAVVVTRREPVTIQLIKY